MSTMMFISRKLNPDFDKVETDQDRREKEKERMIREIDKLQDRPSVSKLISYLRWGYIVLLIVAIAAIIAGWWFWLR